MDKSKVPRFLCPTLYLNYYSALKYITFSANQCSDVIFKMKGLDSKNI